MKQNTGKPHAYVGPLCGLQHVVIPIKLSLIAKAIPLQALTGPEGSRRVRLPDFKTVGT
jgi:hypothetical protein